MQHLRAQKPVTPDAKNLGSVLLPQKRRNGEKVPALPGYDALRKQVEAVLLQGRRAVERAKVETYHKTGELIDKYLLKNKERADFGARTVEKLAEDLGVSSDIVWDCVRFFRKIPFPDARQEMNLSWTHYRELIKISDDKLRLDFIKRAEKGEWTYRKLASNIQAEVTHTKDPKGKKASGRLIERLGKPHTYPVILFEGELRIDVGFENRYTMPEESRGLKAGDLVESFAKDVKDSKGKMKKEFSFKKSDRTKADLYTYNAHIEKIIDGDTIRAVIDEGFYMEICQRLRLRGIDCPEIDTPEGKRAKAFVEKELKGLDHIIIVTSRSDKFDRYLADIYYVPKNPNKKDKNFGHCTASLEMKESGEQCMPKGEKDYKFLNQILLDTGHAVRMEF